MAELALETAQAFWSLLLPHGFKGGALVRNNDEQDVNMDGDGWKEEYIQWWFDFLHERGGKGVSKDTWIMVSSLLHSAHRKCLNIRRYCVETHY